MGCVGKQQEMLWVSGDYRGALGIWEPQPGPGWKDVASACRLDIATREGATRPCTPGKQLRG